MANIGVIGTGYVGLTTAVCFAELGHKVIGFDIDSSKIDVLASGKSTIHEEGMSDLIVKNLANDNLTFKDQIDAIMNCEFIFLCVPTPQDADGSADLSYVIKATKDLGPLMRKDSVLITKSTVPVNAWKEVVKALNRSDIAVVSNPEFLREGSAITDFFAPDRIVVGCMNIQKAKQVSDLYKQPDVETIITDNSSAELIKYASNSFLAIKLSYVNEIAALCESVGANAKDVLFGMGKDSRIGSRFLEPGPGWGGSCFPKDVRALRVTAEDNAISMSLLSAAIDSNEKTHRRIVDKVEKELGNSLIGKTVCIWGLTFKANTDDLRESPAIAVIERLIGRGASVTAFDPVIKTIENKKIKIVESVEDACKSVDAILVLTEWDHFKKVNPDKVKDLVKNKVIIDARNILDKNLWVKSGFNFIGNGWQ